MKQTVHTKNVKKINNMSPDRRHARRTSFIENRKSDLWWTMAKWLLNRVCMLNRVWTEWTECWTECACSITIITWRFTRCNKTNCKYFKWQIVVSRIRISKIARQFEISRSNTFIEKTTTNYHMEHAPKMY